MSQIGQGQHQGWFATTQWSVVVSAGNLANPESREALETLCVKYWLPVYSYIRRRGRSPDDAQDLTQEFFTKLIEQNRVARADPNKGRFRSFLLTSVKNFLADEWDRSRAQKRGGGVPTLSLEFETGEALYQREPIETVTPEQLYERRWALTVLERVLSQLSCEMARDGKADLFAALSPCLVGERSEQPYALLAHTLNMSEAAIKSAVHRLRGRYRDLLRHEIAHTVQSQQEIDDELRYLFTVLAG